MTYPAFAPTNANIIDLTVVPATSSQSEQTKLAMVDQQFYIEQDGDGVFTGKLTVGGVDRTYALSIDPDITVHSVVAALVAGVGSVVTVRGVLNNTAQGPLPWTVIRQGFTIHSIPA